MKKTLGMVFFLTVLAGMAGCGQKNTANTTEQTDTQTEKTLEEHFFSAEQDEQNYNVMEEYSEDEEYPELAAFLTEYYQIPEEECKETRYYYNYTDLDEDGTDEIVAESVRQSQWQSMIIWQNPVLCAQLKIMQWESISPGRCR